MQQRGRVERPGLGRRRRAALQVLQHLHHLVRHSTSHARVSARMRTAQVVQPAQHASSLTSRIAGAHHRIRGARPPRAVSGYCALVFGEGHEACKHGAGLEAARARAQYLARRLHHKHLLLRDRLEQQLAERAVGGRGDARPGLALDVRQRGVAHDGHEVAKAEDGNLAELAAQAADVLDHDRDEVVSAHTVHGFASSLVRLWCVQTRRRDAQQGGG